MNFAILTTGNLPEAYVMVAELRRQNQTVALWNLHGRTLRQSLLILQRLARKRGARYVADLLLARWRRRSYLPPNRRPFPEITPARMAEIRQECLCRDITDPHAAETIAGVAEFQPDYLLLLGAPVIRPELFTLARRGALNWHHGLAPRYRGSDCPLWAMANNEFNQIGFTIHQVSEVVDGGHVLLQRPTPARKDLDFAGAVADIARQGLNGFLEVIDQILTGASLNARPQEKGGVHYPPIPWTALRRAYNNFQEYVRR